ncbi:unnamed protein product [Caenorhabditis auriculariae]|uniref:BHLH domain-containing protein n=1 Tax=Caenorhabditis auriculariae TaxID=2777116 RepID=A0A8S1GYU6_9PELO|nr:unnamed protein product [Caenorhabditis auriculariae]
MAHEQIHSGHFMTSNPHTEVNADDDDEDIEVDVVEDDEKPEDTSVGCSNQIKELEEKPVTFYKFGPKKTQSIAIDVSLNKLNKCIKVAYNKMTTPKWKDFKGLRLHWKQRIRLNNVIWRAYYIEFRKKTPTKKKTPFCYFAVPDDDMTHQKIEGSLLEGMYWKRRMEAVCAQYKRWRIRSKQNIVHDKCHRRKRTASATGDVSQTRVEGEPPNKTQRSQTPKNMSSEYFDVDDYENVFTDELFESLNQPYMFPNPKEMLQSGNADIMQPGLLSLQPSLEEIMASLGDFPDPPTPNKPHEIAIPPEPPSQPILDSMGPPQDVPRRPQPPQLVAQSQTTRPSQQDYVAASMLVDYSNQAVAMPTRQSSSITSQMLMMTATSSQPLYSHAQFQSLRNQSLSTSPWKQNNFLVSLPGTSGSNELDPKPLGVHVGSHSDYMPQFLSSPSLASQNAMMAPAKSWWLDSPLTASVQSPLSVATPLSLSNHHGPATPLSHLLPGPSTPPTILLAMSDSVGSSKMNDDSDLCNPMSVVNKLGSLAYRLEQPPIVLAQKEQMYSSPLERKSTNDWNVANQRIRTSSLCLDNVASPTASWKFSPAIDPSSLYQHTSAFTAGTSVVRSLANTNAPTPQSVLSNVSEDDMSSSIADAALYRGTSLSSNSVPTTPAEKVELKEEPMLLSAPSSVKPARGSRQVQADSTLHPEERKRILHLHAEQNRRSALKDGFDQLMEMVPNLYSGGVKPTNAVVLAKAADHIRRLQSSRESQSQEIEDAKSRIERLNHKIAALQSNLPASAGSSSRVDSKTALESFFERYVKEGSRKDWRFWVMCRMLQSISAGTPASFASNIAGEGASREEISATCSDWFEKHWKASELRPLASTLLVHLATNTNVLTDPQSLQDYVIQQLKSPL